MNKKYKEMLFMHAYCVALMYKSDLREFWNIQRCCPYAE